MAVALGVALLSAGPASAISGGSDVNDGGYPFVAKLTIGDTDRACSGTLVHPQLILTAAACFADADGTVAAGEPKLPTTAVIGRANLAGSGGTASVVTDVIAHPDRDLALARLETPVSGVTPIAISTTPPVAGDTLTLAGYGRTATEWVPDRMKYARFSVDTVGAGTIEVTSTDKANVCKGDAGGPAFRESGGTVQLVALHHDSNQFGCTGEPEGTARATETRVDDVAGWIKANLPGFVTGFETTDARPNFFNTVNTRTGGGGLSNVGGVTSSLTGPELKAAAAGGMHTGAQGLLYSGKDTSATSSYAYTVGYQLSNTTVRPGSTLSYWIFPQSTATSTLVAGSNSTCVAVDLVFTDNSNLRDSGLKDQRGNQAHPAKQCGKLTLDTWNEVKVPIGDYAAGKKIALINVGYDQPANTGGYRGFIDDLAITDTVSPPKFSSGLETGQPALTWTNTATTVKPSGGLKNVLGVCCSLTGPETGLRADGLARTGANVLMYSGKDNDATSSYAYTKAFALTDVYVTPSTRLSYWIYPQSKNKNSNVTGNNSKCSSVDLIFVDQFDDTSVSLRDSAARDQHGLKVHPGSSAPS